MTTIGYIRVRTDKQDLEKQRHLLLEYAQRQQLRMDEFIHAEISSRKDSLFSINSWTDSFREV